MSEINWKNKCWVTTIYLVNKDNKVLLTWNKNLQAWIPVGGHIEPGETPEEAVMREVQEETGFKFDFLDKPHYESNNKVKVINPNRVQIEDVPHHNKHINFVFFGKCSFYQEDRKETDENEKLRWFSEEDIKMEVTMLENVRNSALEAISSVKQSEKTDKAKD